jgi:DNA polymerase-1
VPSTKAQPARVVLLDGHSLAYRAFFALPPDLRTSTGQVTNAVYGFTSMLLKALADYKTAYIAVAFDRGPPLERLAIRPEYKATRRETPDEFRQQLGLIREVLSALRIPVFEMDNVEADDIISIIGGRVADLGGEVIIVTADRDFFQMVAPRVRLMMNRRGISDTIVYDEAAVRQRYGFGPDRYLDYAALRGDPSDNIDGVPGIGEKGAAKLILNYGTLEEIFAHLDELPPRQRTNLGEAQQRLLENREFFRFRTADDLARERDDTAILDVALADLRMGDWDLTEIRRLFDVLEFRVLYERLTESLPDTPIAVEGFHADTAEVGGVDELEMLAVALSREPSIAIRVSGDRTRPREPATSIALSVSGMARVVRFGPEAPGGITADEVRRVLGPVLAGSRITTHGSKEVLMRLGALGIEVPDIAMDTEVAAYLVDPARGSYGLDELSRRYLDRELRLEAEPPTKDESGGGGVPGRRGRQEQGGQQSFLLEPATGTGAGDQASFGLEAIATAELAGVLEKELRERGAWTLLGDLELPLARVLAKMENAGVRINVDYLGDMAQRLRAELGGIEEEIYRLAEGPFNIGSPPQLRQVLYERLGLKPSKRTKTGFSTDASVLETLRDQHPIIDSILRYRERSKLLSTYIEALPPLVDPRTGRLHARFNQTVATTGRLSSDRPNLQNIPIRSDEGRQIRRAFVPEPGHLLLVADYSQIELRVLAHLSEDPELMGAFERGEDIHRRSIARALGMEESEVTSELRSIGKMVSYGVTYGMGPFGLSQRLRIPVDQARTYIDGFFSLYPRVRSYLDGVVEQATVDGFTTTILGRRRYLPELASRNPRVRSLGERMALNAPIQGSAADIIKLAMVEVDRVLEAPDGRSARMVLTVHDELVVEVAEEDVDKVSRAVRGAMEGAVPLKVPLKADLASGKNWADAKG